jgi:hypothetical protein
VTKFLQILLGYIIWAWGAIFGVVVWAFLDYVVRKTNIPQELRNIGFSIDVNLISQIVLIAIFIAVLTRITSMRP